MRFWKYCLISTALFSAMIVESLLLYPNYFSALVGIPDSAIKACIVINFAGCIATLWFKLVTLIFLGNLNPHEFQSIYQRGWVFFCNSLLFWGTSSIDSHINSYNLGIGILAGLTLLVLHWICRSRVRGLQAFDTSNVNWQSLLKTARLATLCVLLAFVDFGLCQIVVEKYLRHDFSLYFAIFTIDLSEMCIVICGELVVNLIAIRHLYLHEDDDEWEHSNLLSDIAHMISSVLGIGAHFFIIREFGIWQSDVGSAVMRGIRFYQNATKFYKGITAKSELDKFTTAALEEELLRDNTCVICRDEMHAADAHHKRKAARKLGCGHIMHSGCLASWMSRSQNCPTCRQPVQSAASSFREGAARAGPAGGAAVETALMDGAPPQLEPVEPVGPAEAAVEAAADIAAQNAARNVAQNTAQSAAEIEARNALDAATQDLFKNAFQHMANRAAQRAAPGGAPNGHPGAAAGAAGASAPPPLGNLALKLPWDGPPVPRYNPSDDEADDTPSVAQGAAQRAARTHADGAAGAASAPAHPPLGNLVLKLPWDGPPVPRYNPSDDEADEANVAQGAAQRAARTHADGVAGAAGAPAHPPLGNLVLKLPWDGPPVPRYNPSDDEADDTPKVAQGAARRAAAGAGSAPGPSTTRAAGAGAGARAGGPRPAATATWPTPKPTPTAAAAAAATAAAAVPRPAAPVERAADESGTPSEIPSLHPGVKEMMGRLIDCLAEREDNPLARMPIPLGVRMTGEASGLLAERYKFRFRNGEN